jgi:hypothetical protein
MVTVEEDFGLRRPKRLPAGTGHSGPGTRRGLRIEATDREQLLGQGHQRLVEGVRGGTATPGLPQGPGLRGQLRNAGGRLHAAAGRRCAAAHGGTGRLASRFTRCEIRTCEVLRHIATENRDRLRQIATDSRPRVCPVRATGPAYGFGEDVTLKYYSVQKVSDGSIELESGDGPGFGRSPPWMSA